jgi:electron transfer flavoprotein alpha/beta subunit
MKIVVCVKQVPDTETVCVKQVPDTETRVQIAPEGTGIVESDVNWIVSPYDEFAIEEALKIKEAQGGEVVLVTVGPDRAQSALRTGLAMGADSAVHVKDASLDGADTLVTARALAGAVKTLAPYDLVLCGQQGVGGDNSQIPGLLAEMLDLPQVTVAIKIEVQDGKATVEREIEGAHENHAPRRGRGRAGRCRRRAQGEDHGDGAAAGAARGHDDRGRAGGPGQGTHPPPPRGSEDYLREERCLES